MVQIRVVLYISGCGVAVALVLWEHHVQVQPLPLGPYGTLEKIGLTRWAFNPVFTGSNPVRVTSMAR